MTDLNHMLRRLQGWQIAALGVLAWLLGLAVVVFVLCPLADGLVPGLGMAAAILGGIAVGLTVPRFFTQAYMDRKHDEIVLAYVEDFAARQRANRG
jgi:hypothetical protein